MGALKDSDGDDVDGAQMATTRLWGDFTCSSDDWDWTASSDNFGKAAANKPTGCSEGGGESSLNLLIDLSHILLEQLVDEVLRDVNDDVEPKDSRWNILTTTEAVAEWRRNQRRILPRAMGGADRQKSGSCQSGAREEVARRALRLPLPGRTS